MATSYWLEDAERVQMLIAVRRLGAARPRDPTTRDAPIAALVTATGAGIMERRYGTALWGGTGAHFAGYRAVLSTGGHRHQTPVIGDLGSTRERGEPA